VCAIKRNNLESSSTKLYNNDLTKNTNKEDTNEELVCKDVGKDIKMAINASTAAIEI
jgi:hypothetical protein